MPYFGVRNIKYHKLFNASILLYHLKQYFIELKKNHCSDRRRQKDRGDINRPFSVKCHEQWFNHVLLETVEMCRLALEVPFQYICIMSLNFQSHLVKSEVAVIIKHLFMSSGHCWRIFWHFLKSIPYCN